MSTHKLIALTLSLLLNLFLLGGFHKYLASGNHPHEETSLKQPFKVRLVPLEPKPKEAQPEIAKKPKPKPQSPKPKAPKKPKPKTQKKPVPRLKKPAPRPQVKPPIPKPTSPSAQPTAPKPKVPQPEVASPSTPVTEPSPAPSSRILTTEAPSSNAISHPTTQEPSSPEVSNGQAKSQTSSASSTPGPEPQPEPTPEPEPEPGPEPQPEPTPEPEPEPEPEPPAPEVDYSQEAYVSAPSSLSLPASLRQKQQATSVLVRATIYPNGSCDFSILQSSGDSQIDNYIINQLRSSSSASPKKNKQGEPRKSVMKIRVDILVN